MIAILRRYLVLAALAFWLGGFTFYASVVVPVGQEVLGHLGQGFITQQVTNFLNLSGAVALLPLAWDVLAGRDPAPWRRRARGLLWVGMLLTLAALGWQHGRLDALLDPANSYVADHRAFRAGHRLYLWVSTAQWGCGLLYMLLMLCAWRSEDRTQGEGGKKCSTRGSASYQL